MTRLRPLDSSPPNRNRQVMKLIYRGIPYEALSTREAKAPVARHTPRQPVSPKARLRSSGQELTYRGVRYIA